MRLFLFFVLGLVCLAAVAYGDAVLRSGDPVDLKISGVPTEEQAQVNNIYSVDANGMVNMPYINKVRAAGAPPRNSPARSRAAIGPRRFSPTPQSRS